YKFKTITRRCSIHLSYLDSQGIQEILEFNPVPSALENCMIRRSIDLASAVKTEWTFLVEMKVQNKPGLKRESSETCTLFLKLREQNTVDHHKFIQLNVTVTCKCSLHPISSLVHPLDFVNPRDILEINSNFPIAIAKHVHDPLKESSRYSPLFQVMITEYDISKATLVPLEIQKLMARKSCIADIKPLYTKMILPFDVTIKCRRGTEFSAHKDILAARSPVFKAMLSSEFKEGKTGTINIHDLSGDAMQILLYFVYNGGLHENWKSATEEVVYAADKYGLPQLKHFFDHLLLEVVNIGNALKLLQLAERHSLPYATASISDFVDRIL
ncbi:Speckle-type POZ protein, partial [Orchesella cincta]